MGVTAGGQGKSKWECLLKSKCANKINLIIQLDKQVTITIWKQILYFDLDTNNILLINI